MGMICIMILPVPSWALDIGLATSFSLAILMFTVTLFIQRPLDFSAFPTILLGSLILRLSLNIASTKLIIGQGHTGTGAAGEVIEGFALFVMNGNVALGLVVFCVLLMVNFLVINKGATRMAEVGARFALDAMPGKQLAIDSDLASGAITHEVAKERREREQAETTFFGSLDGASKFVKGDAIAGLLITLLNLFVGLSIGVLSHNMSLSDGFATYSILTVGDGLVSQIPAVLISVASALLLARGGASGTTDTAISEQLGKHPSALMSVAALLALFALIPGLPFLPFIFGSIILALASVYSYKNGSAPAMDSTADQVASEEENTTPSLANSMETDEIHIEFATDLTSMALDPKSGLDTRIANIRKHIAREYGVLLPEIHLTDSHGLTTGDYVIKIMGVAHGKYNLRPDHLLVLTQDSDAAQLSGERVKEPVFNAPAIWVEAKLSEEATLKGLTVVQPAEVLATHLLEVLKQNFSKILTLSALQHRLVEMTQLLDPIRATANKRLIDSLIPEKVPLELLHATLRSLLTEQISIRNLQLIIESVAEGRQFTQNWDAIYEHVRTRLGFQIIETLQDSDDFVNVIQLAQEWEQVFLTYQTKSETGQRPEISLPPNLLQDLIDRTSDKIGKSSKNGIPTAIVTGSNRRRFLRTVLSARGIHNSVIAYEEIEPSVKLNLVGVIET